MKIRIVSFKNECVFVYVAQTTMLINLKLKTKLPTHPPRKGK